MQRYFVKEKQGNFLILENSDVHHIKNVMRYKEGDKIECVYEENLYHCEIINPGSNQVQIISSEENTSTEKYPLTIAVGLVKEQKFDLIIQKLTELGVKEIIPLKMERNVVKLGEEKIQKKQERWQKIAKEAAEQSKRTTIPKIYTPISINELSQLSYDNKFVCSTKRCEKLNYNYLQNLKECATMIFVIGPEGGITEKEEEVLLSSGYSPISFGEQIMRVETATIYVASIVQFMK